MGSTSRRRSYGGLLLVLAVASNAVPAPARADAGSAVQRFAALSVSEAEAAGVARSPDVEAARAGVDAAAAALAQARGVNGFSLLVGYATTPQGSDTPIQWQQRLGVYQLQTTLGDVQAYEPLVIQAKAALAQSLTDELVAERSERLKIIVLYDTALQSRVQHEAKDDAVASAEAFEDDVRGRYAAGKLPRLDLLRAQVATAKARADQANAAGTDANAVDALAREVDRPAADFRELIDDPPREAVVVDADTAVARALATRPEMRSANQTIAAATAARAAALRGMVPPVTLAGGYLHGDDGGSIVSGPVFSASVTIPLSGVDAAKVHAQDAAIRTATSHRAGVARALAIEVGSAARTAAAAVIAHDATVVEVDLAKSELDLAASEYRRVPASGITVSVARDLYEQAVADEIAARYAQVQAQATLDAELSP